MSEPIVKKKKNDWWKGLLIGILVVVIIIGAPIAGIFIAFYDDSQNSPFIDKNETPLEVFTRVINNSLDDIKDSKEVSFKLTENDFNQILVPAINEKIEGTADQYINSFYLDITEDRYNFVVELKENFLNLFKTKAVISTKMEHHKAENIEDDFFEFHITDIKLGRLGGLLSLGKTLMNSFGVGYYINSFLESSGLSMTFELENNRIVYNTLDLVNDIFTMSSPNQGDLQAVFPSIIDICIDNKKFDFNFHEEEAFEMVLNLESFGFNSEYCNIQNEESGVTIDFQRHIDDLLTLVENNIVTYDDIGMLMHYLIHGYEKTDSSNQDLVKTLDLSSIGIDDPTSYVGDYFPEPISLKNHVLEQIKNADLTPGSDRHLATITETTLNDMVGATDIIGYSLLLPSLGEDGHTKITYVTIDKFYLNIEDGIIKVVARVNINGYYSYLILEYSLNLSNSDYSKIVLSPKHTLIGGLEASDDLLHYFYNIIGEGFDTLDCTSFDKNSGEIVIDFTDAFNEAGNLDTILLFGQPKTSLIGENLQAEGIIRIDF